MPVNFSECAKLDKLNAYLKFHAARMQEYIAVMVAKGWPDKKGHPEIRAQLSSRPDRGQAIDYWMPEHLKLINQPKLN